jgi:REP element-mobilizing transposase RayT
MPDHVHLLFSVLNTPDGEPYPLASIMSGIKGASAHTINKKLGRKGHVWEEESFDRLLRSDEKLREKADYICANPVRAGLCRAEDDWPWLWREWIEGLAGPEATAPHGDPTAEGGCDPVS